MSQIDSFNLNLKVEKGELIIINEGYRIKIEELYKNFSKVLQCFVSIKNIVQQILEKYYITDISKILKEHGETLWIY